MSYNKDWLPTSRSEQLNMAKVWAPAMDAKKTAWNIPQTVLTAFQPLISSAESILAQLDSPDLPKSLWLFGSEFALRANSTHLFCGVLRSKTPSYPA